MAAARYSFLASFSAANKWKHATFRFTVKLAWVELFRSDESQCIFDVREIGPHSMRGVRARDLFD